MAQWQRATAVAGVVGALVIGVAGCGTARPNAGGQGQAAAENGQGSGTGARSSAPGAARTRTAAPGSGSGADLANPELPHGGPVPPGFAATSVTFVSPGEALVLGTAPCANRPCTSIVRTMDRGATWRGLPAPVTPLASPYTGDPGVWGIRFGTPGHGFVFGNGLWETRDGGEHWVRDTWRHGSVLSLAVVDGEVLALAARCTAAGGCGRTSVLLRRPLAGGRWTLAASLGSPGRFGLTGAIATWARTAALVAGGKVLISWDGGRTFHGRATPCTTPAKGSATSVAVASRRDLALLCTGQGFTGNTVKMVYTSSDGGLSWTLAGKPPTPGDGGLISAAGPERLTIATASAASWLYYSADAGARWSTSRSELDGGFGWADLGFTTLTDGVVVRGPAYSDGNTDHRPGQLLLTDDAGARWRRVRF